MDGPRIPVRVAPLGGGRLAAYRDGRVLLSPAALDEGLYWPDLVARGIRYGGRALTLAHEVGHAFEARFDDRLADPAYNALLGVIDPARRAFVSPGPDLLGRGHPGCAGSPSEAAANAFADHVLVPAHMAPGPAAFIAARLAEAPGWPAIVAALRLRPDPRDWLAEGVITG